MNKPIQIRGLFETHLTVSDIQRSIRFYCDIVGLRLAYEIPERGELSSGLVIRRILLYVQCLAYGQLVRLL